MWWWNISVEIRSESIKNKYKFSTFQSYNTCYSIISYKELLLHCMQFGVYSKSCGETLHTERPIFLRANTYYPLLTPLGRPPPHFLVLTSQDFNCFHKEGGARLGCTPEPEKDLLQAQMLKVSSLLSVKYIGCRNYSQHYSRTAWLGIWDFLLPPVSSCCRFPRTMHSTPMLFQDVLSGSPFKIQLNQKL